MEGLLYHEMCDGYGVGTNLEYAFKNIDGSNDREKNSRIVTFKYYFDPMIGRAMIELYNYMKGIIEKDKAIWSHIL